MAILGQKAEAALLGVKARPSTLRLGGGDRASGLPEVPTLASATRNVGQFRSAEHQAFMAGNVPEPLHNIAGAGPTEDFESL
jgi:hypothetical protein